MVLGPTWTEFKFVFLASLLEYRNSYSSIVYNVFLCLFLMKEHCKKKYVNHLKYILIFYDH
jgi:hypothetical protein